MVQGYYKTPSCCAWAKAPVLQPGVSLLPLPDSLALIDLRHTERKFREKGGSSDRSLTMNSRVSLPLAQRGRAVSEAV
jgi:hypothetical protein